MIKKNYLSGTKQQLWAAHCPLRSARVTITAGSPEAIFPRHIDWQTTPRLKLREQVVRTFFTGLGWLPTRAEPLSTRVKIMSASLTLKKKKKSGTV